ncbi:MAG: hypothetical protein IJC34_11180 [Lentisphaeria bacterium]|nr:hypothetical protein [Lentisphaeria bacterium]
MGSISSFAKDASFFSLLRTVTAAGYYDFLFFNNIDENPHITSIRRRKVPANGYSAQKKVIFFKNGLAKFKEGAILNAIPNKSGV